MEFIKLTESLDKGAVLVALNTITLVQGLPETTKTKMIAEITASESTDKDSNIDVVVNSSACLSLKAGDIKPVTKIFVTETVSQITEMLIRN